MAIEEKEKKDPMAVMAESFKTLTDFMTQMGADRAEERQEREKERQELRVEREQSSKMLNDLLSKLTVNGNTASISSVGPSIDALEARIIEFVYDEEECTFESWFSRYEYIFWFRRIPKFSVLQCGELALTREWSLLGLDL